MANGKFKIQNYDIATVMDNTKKGEYVIPPFQRDYVWKPEQITSLMDSISKGFPIGVLTTTDSKTSTFKDGKNEIIDLISSENAMKNWVVVDGQQRLTSIATIYFAPEISENIEKLNLSNQTLMRKVFKNTLFYKGKFYVSKNLSRMLEDEGQKTKREIQEILLLSSVINQDVNNQIKEKLNDFPMHFLKLSDWDNKEVIKIFTAMNKGTKPLTHVDLMNGSMFNSSNTEFDLIKYIKEVNENYKNSGTIKPEYMVQLIKIYYDIVWEDSHVDYSKQKLLSFSMEKSKVNLFVSNKKEFEKYLIDALSLLETTFNFYSIDNLPKNVYLSITLSLVCKYKGKDNVPKDILKRSISLVTKRLIDGDYASSPGTKTLEDINNMTLKMNPKKLTEHEAILSRSNEEKYKEQLGEKFKEISYKNKNNSLFKLALSVMASCQPRMLFEANQFVPVRPSEISAKDTDLHHFIPKNSNFVKSRDIPPRWINSIGNIILITADENRKEIRNKDIDAYLKDSEEKLNEKGFKEMLESHLINKELLDKVISLDENNDNLDAIEKVMELFEERAENISKRVFNKFIKI